MVLLLNLVLAMCQRKVHFKTYCVGHNATKKKRSIQYQTRALKPCHYQPSPNYDTHQLVGWMMNDQWWWMMNDPKMFRKFLETSFIISLKKENLPYLAVFRKTFFIGKYSNFNFQNRGYFGQKNIPQISWNFGHN